MNSRIILNGKEALWQLSPLTDTTLTIKDIPIQQGVASAYEALSVAEANKQEWHLMRFFEVDEALLNYPAIELVMSGISRYAEVRINGVAVFDCTEKMTRYRKDIKEFLQLGGNRFEILFLEEDDDDWLLDEELDNQVCEINQAYHRRFGAVQEIDIKDDIGVFGVCFFQPIPHLSLNHISVEQIWHHGCELKIDVHFKMYRPNLISASIKFDGMTLTIPVDVRGDHVSALFQVEAPKYWDDKTKNPNDLYVISVMLDGQHHELEIGLSNTENVIHFPL
ncbi:glycosyl hydrolase 2 galactose-binding domain-containing protein [Aliivibrio wodanis]|uniref:glycosyl hydrolase 2 galactose-binding domain-containing protein n=1 Tax=Aliivibrio wodanis TaxID=80852 RepID=UPI00406D213A